MGIQAIDCITPSMFDDNNRKGLVNGLLRFALRGSRFGLKPITFLQSDRMHECTFFLRRLLSSTSHQSHAQVRIR